MNKKDIYQQKAQAQLDEWKAELDKLKAKASGASADAQLELNKHVETLSGALEEGKAKLAEIKGASEDALESVIDRGEAALSTVKSTFNDVAAKIKR